MNFLKFEFSKSNGLYIILIRENEISKNFRFKNELDIYVRYIILNDLIEVFFNDEKENINKIYEIEKYSNDFFNLIIGVIKNCFYYFNEQKDILDLRDIYKDGYKVYEVMQCIQEGKNSKDNIINYLKEIHKEEIEKKTKINQNEINNKFSINHTLSKIEKLSLFPSKDFMNNIKKSIDKDNIYFNNKNKNKNNKHRNQQFEYDDLNFSESLNLIMKIINKINIFSTKINNKKKLDLVYKLQNFKNEDELFNYLTSLQNEIINIKSKTKKNLINDNDLINEFQCKSLINNSILKYQSQKPYFLSKDTFYKFIVNNNIIEKNILEIKNIIKNENEKLFINIDKKIKYNIIRKIIYENFLSIYILFKFLKDYEKDFKKEKNLFLDIFINLLKYENNKKSKDYSLINENIIIILLLNIIHNFDNIDIIIPFLKEGLFSEIISLKFYKRNKYLKHKYLTNYITLNECFKQFTIKIFREEKIFQNLLEGIFKYIIANLTDNNEINFDNFLELCSELIKEDRQIFGEALLNTFDIIEIDNKENKNNDKDEDLLNKKYILKIKYIFEKNIQSIRNELKNQEDKEKDTKLEKKINSEINNSYQLFSETNKNIFIQLLDHICKTTLEIENFIDTNKIFVRNYLIDLNTSLITLINILYSFPSYLSLILKFHKGTETKSSFIKIMLGKIFFVMNYFHFSNEFTIEYDNYEQLMNIIKNDFNIFIKEFENQNKSFINLMETSRNINIMIPLIHVMTYKKWNMNENEILLVNKCRRKIINEINLSLIEIINKNIKDFNTLQYDNRNYPKSLIIFKCNLIALLALSAFDKDKNIYRQNNVFENSKLILRKKNNIIKNISLILKSMEINNNYAIFHKFGIVYLYKMIKLNLNKINFKASDLNFNSIHNKLEKESKEINQETKKNKNSPNIIKNKEIEKDKYDNNIEMYSSDLSSISDSSEGDILDNSLNNEEDNENENFEINPEENIVDINQENINENQSNNISSNDLENYNEIILIIAII